MSRSGSRTGLPGVRLPWDASCVAGPAAGAQSSSPQPKRPPLSSPSRSPLPPRASCPRALHATRCTAGIPFINSKNCRLLFFIPLHLLSPQSNTAAAFQRLHLSGLLPMWCSASRAHNPPTAASTLRGAKFQLSLGLAVAPRPVTHWSDLLTAKQLEFSSSSLPTSPRARCSPACTACAGALQKCVGREGQDLGHLDPSLYPSCRH